MEWTIPAFAYPAEAGTDLPTPIGWKTELALGGWLHTEINVRHLDVVAYLSANRARRRLTSLIEANTLTTTSDRHRQLKCCICYLDPRCSVKDRQHPNDGVCERGAVSTDAGHNAWWSRTNQGPVVICSCKVEICVQNLFGLKRVVWIGKLPLHDYSPDTAELATTFSTATNKFISEPSFGPEQHKRNWWLTRRICSCKIYSLCLNKKFTLSIFLW